MTEQGLFDPFVNFLVSKAGNNVAVITVISAIVAHFSHLDIRHYQHIAGYNSLHAAHLPALRD